MPITEKIETKTSTIWIDEEGILHLKIKEGSVVDLDDAKVFFDSYRKLGCHENKVLELMTGGTFFTFNKSAMQYSAKQGKHYFIATALINNSLAIRLLFNFFNN